MKHIKILTAFASVIVFAGCNRSPTPEVDTASTTNPPPRFEQVKEETKDAARTAKEYAYAQKSEFAEKMRRELDKLNQEMDALGDKIESSTSTTKDEAKTRLQALREKKDELAKRLDRVSEANEGTWDEFKAGFKQGYEDTKKSVNEARQWLSEKIAPK